MLYCALHTFCSFFLYCALHSIFRTYCALHHCSTAVYRPTVFMIDLRIETGVLNVIIIAASELNILIRRESNFLVDTG